MSYYIDNYVCIKGKTKEETSKFFDEIKKEMKEVYKEDLFEKKQSSSVNPLSEFFKQGTVYQNKEGTTICFEVIGNHINIGEDLDCLEDLKEDGSIGVFVGSYGESSEDTRKEYSFGNEDFVEWLYPVQTYELPDDVMPIKEQQNDNVIDLSTARLHKDLGSKKDKDDIITKELER